MFQPAADRNLLVRGGGHNAPSSRDGERVGVRGTNRARDLRKAHTDAEAKLWWHLRDRRLGGYKFRRQHPFGNYVVDFVCIEQTVIVELDGGHQLDQVEYDARRTRYLNSIGFTVMRYWDDDALMRTERVLEDILMRTQARKYTSPHPDPLPASGAREGSSNRS